MLVGISLEMNGGIINFLIQEAQQIYCRIDIHHHKQKSILTHLISIMLSIFIPDVSDLKLNIDYIIMKISCAKILLFSL